MCKKIKVWVDKETCIACGACVALVPEVFQFGSDGKAEAIQSIIEDEELINRVIEARDSCHTGSIKTEEIE